MVWWRRRQSPPLAPVSLTAPLVLTTYDLLRQTTAFLQLDHDTGAHEEVVYWAGRTSPGIWVLTTVIAPFARTTTGSFEVSLSANADVIAFLAEHRLELLAQVHSHPGASVAHSRGDDAGALMPYAGLLSIVVPNHGRAGMDDLETCGVHRFEGGRFRRLSRVGVRSSFHVVPGSWSFRQEGTGVP